MALRLGGGWSQARDLPGECGRGEVGLCDVVPLPPGRRGGGGAAGRRLAPGLRRAGPRSSSHTGTRSAARPARQPAGGRAGGPDRGGVGGKARGERSIPHRPRGPPGRSWLFSFQTPGRGAAGSASPRRLRRGGTGGRWPRVSGGRRPASSRRPAAWGGACGFGVPGAA